MPTRRKVWLERQCRNFIVVNATTQFCRLISRSRSDAEHMSALQLGNLPGKLGRLSSLFAVATLLLMLGAVFFVFPVQPFVLLLFFPRRQTRVKTASPPLPVAPLEMSPGVSIPRLITRTLLTSFASAPKAFPVSSS